MNTINHTYYLTSAPVFYYSMLIIALTTLLFTIYNFFQQRKAMKKRIELTTKFNKIDNKEKEKKAEIKKEEEQTLTNKKKSVAKELAIISLLDNLADVICFINLNGDIKYISKTIKDFLGYESKELINARSIAIMAKSDYPRFEMLCKKLYQDINLLEESFSFKTKGGLLKTAECNIKSYSSVQYGEGYLLSIRPVSEDRIKQKVAGEKEQQTLIAERDNLLELNQKLEANNDDLLAKITKILKEQEEQELIEPLEFAEFNAERVLAISNNFDMPNQNLKTQAKRLHKLLDEKRMAKYDLVNFCNAVEQNATYSARKTAFLMAEQALILRILTDYQTQKYNENIQKIVTDILRPLSPLFSSGKQVIELSIDNKLETEIDILVLKELLIYLVTLSLSENFQQNENGIINIKIEKKADKLEITYSDNAIQSTSLANDFYASFLKTKDYPLLNTYCKRFLELKQIEIDTSTNFICKLLC